MSSFKEDIDRFYDYHVHPKSRTLGMFESTNSDGDGLGTDCQMAEKVIKGLHALDFEKEAPITILMNNPGGDEYHGMGIYDAITTCRSHVTIKVFGHAMSMGSLILQAADERLLSPNARIMMHYGTAAVPGLANMHSKDFDRWAEENKKLNKWMEDLYLDKIRKKKPGFTRKRLQDRINFDYFCYADEAVELGLADRIFYKNEFERV